MARKGGSSGQVGRPSLGKGKPHGLARPGGATKVRTAGNSSSGHVARPGGAQKIR